MAPNIAEQINQAWLWDQELPESINICTHELIRRQAQSHPQAFAVRAWDGNLTYAELEEFSTRFAYRLSAEGVSSGTLTPLICSKSKWTIIAMIAVLKAGGAVVPLPPSMPPGRVQAIVGQLNAKLAVASPDCPDWCLDLFQEVFVVSDESIKELTNALDVATVSPVACDPTAIAYVLFTSGSTGVPKGAMIEQRHLSTSAVISGRKMAFDEQTQTLHFASYTFDVAILEIIWTLVWGGCVCVPSEQQRMNSLLETMADMEVTLAFFTPSLLNVISLDKVCSLRTVITGGEKPDPAVVNQLSSTLHMVVVYGPCECSVISSVLDVNEQGGYQRGDLGKPVGSRFWIVNPDNAKQLCAIDQVGEVVIEGPIVGRGYLADKEKSDAAFLKNPPIWSQEAPNSDSRNFSWMYRTGDLAKYTSDGKFLFVGRKDNQVKIRGQRLELDEIESHLRNCIQKRPNIAEIKVSVTSPAGGPESACVLTVFLLITENELVGYLDWDDNDSLFVQTSPAERQQFTSLISHVRNYLLNLVPTYAVPSLYVPLRRFPLTANGKTDIRRLQRMVSNLSREGLAEFQTPTSRGRYPSNAIEKRLANLWTTVLSATGVGLGDHFFQLGGDSLSAMRLVVAARKDGLSLTTEKIRTSPTLEDMALVTSVLSMDQSLTVLPFSLCSGAEKEQLLLDAMAQCDVPRDSIEDLYPLTAQQSFFMDGGLESGHFQRQSVHLVPKSVDRERFLRAWDVVVATYEILRTRIVRRSAGSGYAQVVVKDGIVWRLGESLSEDLEQDHNHIISLGDPLYRFGLIEDHTLAGRYMVLTVQHVAYDAYALFQLFERVDYVYRNGSCPAPDLRFNSFIQATVNMDQQAATDFWSSYLVNAKTKPVGYIKAGQHVYADTSLRRYMHLARATDGPETISTLLTAALALAFANVLECEDVVLELFSSGRSADIPGIEDLLAPTLSAYPLRIHIDPSNRVSKLIHRIQEDSSSVNSFAQVQIENIAKISEELRKICMDTIRVNILPPLAEPVDTELHLPLLWGQSAISRSLRITCTVAKTGIGIEAAFDHNIISVELADTILRKVELALNQVSTANKDRMIRDVELDSFHSLAESYLPESITQKSQEVKSKMLTLNPYSEKSIIDGAQLFIVPSW